MMGSPPEENGRYDDETQHKVTLTKMFYIGVFECTQRQWELVMRDRPSYFNNADCYATRPVEQVSYNAIRGGGWPLSGHLVDESSFMGKLKEKTGLTFDLPTEAQWEFACRAGTMKALSLGENLTSTSSDASMNKVGRYKYNGGSDDSQDCTTDHGTAKVGSYQPNAWGLYDMHGNVFEWCLDWCDGSTYSTMEVTDPVGDTAGLSRVVRGGSWSRYACDCRSAIRCLNDQSDNNGDIGFRIVCLPSKTYAVMVVNGTADKAKATAGEIVTITAYAPPAGKVFDKWIGGAPFDDATSATTTFVMPTKAVMLKALYKKE